MKINKEDLVRLLIVPFNLILITINVVFENYSRNFNIMIAIYVLFISLFLMYKARKNIAIFIVVMFIAYCNYSILYGRYINPSIASINDVLRSTSVDGLAINIMLFFMTCIYFFLKPITKMDFSAGLLMSNESSNIIIAWGAIIIILIASIFSYTPATGDTRAGYSPLYEYSVIFFIVGLYFCGDKESYITKIYRIAMLLYVLRDFIGGHRVPGLQVLIVYFMFFAIQRKNYKQVTIAFLFGIILLNTLAIYRSSFSLHDFSIIAGLKNISKHMFAFNTAYFAYFASLTFIATREFFTMSARFSQFLEFLASQIVVGTVGESLYQISRRYFAHSNGGVLPIYLFYYIGWIGAFLSGKLVSFYLNLINSVDKKSSGIKKVIMVYVIATVPRWYLYSPNQLLRGVLLLSLVYLTAKYIDTKTPTKYKLNATNG